MENRYPLTPLQEGMLFHSLSDTGVGMYVNQVVYTMENININAMSEAWESIINRYTILRSSFDWEDLERPEQCVQETIKVPIVTENWRNSSVTTAQTLWLPTSASGT